MPGLYDAIRDSVELLYAMAMVIRRPAPVDRLVKSAKISVDHFEALDQQHVEECFPNATPTLKRRLAKAIKRRRQMLIYNEQHHEKASKDPGPTVAVDSVHRTEAPSNVRQVDHYRTMVPESAKGIEDGAAGLAAGEGLGIGEGSVRASTEATKFIPPDETKEADVQSESGTISSFGFADSSWERIRIPPLPRDDDGEVPKKFLCPLCYYFVVIETSKAWT